MHELEPVPSGSIYIWMYRQGIHGIPFEQVAQALGERGVHIREKDVENYWNGWHRYQTYQEHSPWQVRWSALGSTPSYHWDDYPMDDRPLSVPSPSNRWVPCNGQNKPMIKWSHGCLTLASAKAMTGCEYLAENLKGCRFIVIDIDGDHDVNLDMETIAFGRSLPPTHTLSKPKSVMEYPGMEASGDCCPASFHLTYAVDRVIPTMHFPNAHIDVIGNARNGLRYMKNKTWNGLQPAKMNEDIWDALMNYANGRKE